MLSEPPCPHRGAAQGASICQKPPIDDVERFLFMSGFDSREKVNALGCYADPKAIETGM